MNPFTVFLAIVAVASANVAGRTGWDSSSPPVPAGPIVFLATEAAGAVSGAAQASAQQQVTEGASGDAHISSINGVAAVIGQGVSDPNTATFNDIAAYNTAQANDNLQASIVGNDLAYVTNNASSDASGSAALAIEAASLNLQINPAPGSPGWRRP